MVSEHYAKSPDGMWVKSVLLESGIELFWQIRTKVVGSEMISYDYNGSVLSSQPINRVVYPEPMKSAGTVPLDDSFVEFCGVDKFDSMIQAIMRHLVGMLVSGYGDTPEEIVSWYRNLSELNFIVGSDFKFVEENEPFLDLLGLTCVVEEVDGEITARISVAEHIFDVPLIDNETIVSFILSTVPV